MRVKLVGWWVLLGASTSVAAQTLAVQTVDPVCRGAAMAATVSIAGHLLVYPCSVPGQCAPRRDATVWTTDGARLSLPGASGTLVVVPAAIGAGDVVAGTLTDSATTATAGGTDGNSGLHPALRTELARQ